MALYTKDRLPASSQDALAQFNERYLAANDAVVPAGWVSDLGDVIEVDQPENRFPLSMLALKYQETRGDSAFTSIGEKDFPVYVAEYDAGVEVSKLDLLKRAFYARRFLDSADRFVKARAQHQQKTLAAALEANTATAGWDGLAIFHAAHQVNPAKPGFGTFSNLQAVATNVVSVANLEAEIISMMGVLDENGDKLDVKPDTIGVPTAKFQPLVNLLKQDIIANTAGTATIRNPYADGTLRVVHMPELTDVNDWYLFDSKLISLGLSPWAVLWLTTDESLALRVFDESSDYFKKSGKLAVSSHVWMGSGFAFPHAIRRVTGA